MTPEDYKTLKEKAELWDSLSDTLKTQFAAKFPYSETLMTVDLNSIKNELSGVILSNNGTTTLQNTSNASSHIGLLEEESKEMVYKKRSDIIYLVDAKTFPNGKVSLIFSADCGAYGTNELIDDFVITAKELLHILKKHDAKV